MDLDSLKWKMRSLVRQAISVYNSMDMDSQPKPFLELISVIKQTTSLFKSLITEESPLLNSVESDWEFISPVDQKLSLRSKPKSDLNFMLLVEKTRSLEPNPELMSLIHQIISLVISMDSEPRNSNLELISLCPQAEVIFEAEVIFGAQGKFHVTGKPNNDGWECTPADWGTFNLTGQGKESTYFYCRECKGQNHENHDKAPTEIKHHPLHPKHSLQLVIQEDQSNTRKCYCGDEDLTEIFYYCLVGDFAMNIVCVEKPPVLSIDHPKWHKHPLAHFPRDASLTCDLCALADSSSPIYMCPSCDFVVHLKCVNLPRVIRISRHPHRISFTHSFDQGDWSCGICRRKMDNDYGGYLCIKEGCSYAAHSRCATQRNVWDGIDLEGVPEEIEEEVLAPFVKISDGIIQHFSHQDHNLRLDENTSRGYDEDKLCQACVTPIYFGNFYSCMQMQCDYTLHETCADHPRRIHHPIHPHLLTLVVGYDGVLNYPEDQCTACPWICTTGFFYKCDKGECDFKLDVDCATISEPLVHESHKHPLYLTSKPEEKRRCGVCNDPRRQRSEATNETFNCIECEFSLCFECATLPQKVRYKHDKHMLTLSYGEEACTMSYWCEVCEEEVNPKQRFYKCDEYCCVTLHIDCLIGEDLYMKPNSSFYWEGNKVEVVPNNLHMSRPFCSCCWNRCPQKIVYELLSGDIYCSVRCIIR